MQGFTLGDTGFTQNSDEIAERDDDSTSAPVLRPQNIRRLANGTESKINFDKKPDSGGTP